MNTYIRDLADKLEEEHRLTRSEYLDLLKGMTPDSSALLAEKAVSARRAVYGDKVYVRGLIEFSNYCRNDCLYCGIRRSNSLPHRYRLSKEEILSCCRIGYEMGYRTFVLQSGEDPYFNDQVMGEIISSIKRFFPDCCITLSLGERSRISYEALFQSGAERYLLRHETADPKHYKRLHPRELSWEHRMNCIRELREIGYQVGTGFMVGSPFQTLENLVEELHFVETFRPDMCGIGPFIPHRDTPFRDEPSGTLERTLYLLSIIRLIEPDILLPSTTALGTIDPLGREKGIAAGANVIMPNLSPGSVRKDYELYDNKICMDEEADQCGVCLSMRMLSAGCRIAVDRGDRKYWREEKE